MISKEELLLKSYCTLSGIDYASLTDKDKQAIQSTYEFERFRLRTAIMELQHTFWNEFPWLRRFLDAIADRLSKWLK